MPLNILKREVAGVGDPADFPASLNAYSLTDRAPVECANQTEANQLAAQLIDDDHLEAFPLFAWLHDSLRLMCKPAHDQGWVRVGGRLHGAHARVDRMCDSGTLTELHINETGFLRQSVGFTRAANGGVLIPETGLYRVRLGGGIDAHSSTAGRRFVSLRLNGENLGGNVEFEGDTAFKLFDEWPFTKGDVLMPLAYQATGTRRLIEATIGVYQSLDPSW